MSSFAVERFTAMPTGVWRYCGLDHRMLQWQWAHGTRTYTPVCKVDAAHQYMIPTLRPRPLTCLACIACEDSRAV